MKSFKIYTKKQIKEEEENYEKDPSKVEFDDTKTQIIYILIFLILVMLIVFMRQYVSMAERYFHIEWIVT